MWISEKNELYQRIKILEEEVAKLKMDTTFSLVNPDLKKWGLGESYVRSYIPDFSGSAKISVREVVANILDILKYNLVYSPGKKEIKPHVVMEKDTT